MRILNISTHAELLVLGTAYLQALGFEVTCVCDLPGVVDSLGMGDEFDLVILCHTLPEAQKRFICGLMRAQCPLARILELYLTVPHATHGVAVEATTEFHQLMRTLASDDTSLEIAAAWRRGRDTTSQARTTLAQ